ncbi:MAG TPA: transglycosylase domain-containing protein [Gemmatimonadaceae bacterium]|nr:transglycosylase domain-containing protein [Gemmatimonadaceae bacterium]
MVPVPRPSARVHRARRIAIIALALLPLLPLSWVLYHVYADDRALPDIERFIRFQLPTTGVVYDARGTVLISVAKEYRRMVSYDEVPVILRQAILATEDKRFFSHAGVDYRVLPRVIGKSITRSLSTWWSGDGELRLRLPQGGSTLTQQLVRGYFLAERTSHEDGETLFHGGAGPRLVSLALGVPTANKVLRKLEEVRLALWVEREMKRRYGSRENAKREIFRRYASFIYLGNGRYGFAAASEYYFGKELSSYTSEDAAEAALLAGITKSPRDYAPGAGAPAPLRRRNEILALMASEGFISKDLATRAQAEPVRVVAVSSIKTHASAAIGSVFGELRKHGGDRFGVGELFLGRVSVRTTVDDRLQRIVNAALETGLARYEQRHPKAKGRIQGSVVVLRNGDAAILAEAGGREVYEERHNAYSDYNRVRDSRRQPGSAWKPIVYLAAFRRGLGLDSIVLDEPIAVPTSANGRVKWIANYDNQFKGAMAVRQALAESRNTVAVWITREIGMDDVIRTARELGIHSPVPRYISMALGASEVRLLELAGAYRAIASGVVAEPYIVDEVNDAAGVALYRAPRITHAFAAHGLREIQEGLRGVVRIPGGTANILDRRDFPIPVLGKTGTTNGFRDALFVGSTWGPRGITVAVRIGFDDNRTLGANETGGRTALPVFREIMLHVYREQLVGAAPAFPGAFERGIDGYLTARAAATAVARSEPIRPGGGE